MHVDSKEAYCGECGQPLNESSENPLKERIPCPNCGSKKRNVRVSTFGSLTVHRQLRIKGRRPGEKKPFIEQVCGDAFQRKSGVWMKLRRIIDRARDWYFEEVVDPRTGKIIHRTEEPLSKHQGHGSARKK
jgi:hypothetical protein